MRVFIDALGFEAILGILPHERQTPQPITVDIFFEYDFNGKDFVDYTVVAEEVEKCMKKGRFELIEEALSALFHTLHENFPQITHLRLKICKPAVLPNCRVCVEDFADFL